MATLTVGVHQEFTTLSAAIAASQNGDVIQVQAGTYTNDFATISDSITIEGVGGMVDLVATEAPTNDKGILVVGTEASSPTVTLDNLEFSGAAVSDGDGGNAAGVRYQSGNLTINDCYFYDNQDGLLADADPTGSVTIRNSEFADNGTDSGLTHNIYIGAVGTFTITGSYITAANNGNEIQSRALVSNITNNRIVDGPTATSSYSINLPNGGVDTVTGNIIEKGPNAQNYTMINFGGATAINGGTYANSSLTVSGNTILNDEPRVAARLIDNHTDTPVNLVGNKVYGLTSAQLATGPVNASGTTYLTTEPAISSASPFGTLTQGAAQVIGSDVYTLPGVVVTVTLGSQSNTVIAAAANLLHGDNIDGGPSGSNTLALTGAGTFNLATPMSLVDFSAITVQEGAGTVLDLRAGLNATVKVTGSGGLTIVGAANSDAINLGPGNVTVTLGAGETVNGGSGSNNTIIVTSSLLGATINGGSGGHNTLDIVGGGTAAMGSGITGISRVELAQATSLTLSSIANLTVFGIAAQVTGSTISNFHAGDVLDITNVADATAALSKIAVGATSTVLTVTDGTNASTIRLNGAFSAGSFQLKNDGSGGTDIVYLPSVGYTLPATLVTMTLGSLSNTVTTTAAGLVPGDNINGGSSGSNTLALSGGGTFNLASVQLAGFSTITVQEGAGTVLDLRNGLNATVNVTGSGGITIVGATNSDVINLGAGNATVTLGAGETVNGGSGHNNTIIVTSALLGATINGGSGGHNTLDISSGGTAVLGSSITGISTVELATGMTFTANATANLQIVGSTGGGNTITLGAASQSVISGGVREHVLATAANAGAEVRGLGAGSELEITTGGTVILNPQTGGSAADPLIVKLDAATNLTLSPIQFIDAVAANNFSATITADAINQTLTGSAAVGNDTLIGYAGGHDMFQGSNASFNGDTIRNFLATDKIDITNLLPGAAILTATASGANTAVTVTSAGMTAHFVLAGSFTQSGFAITADGAGGTLITHN